MINRKSSISEDGKLERSCFTCYHNCRDCGHVTTINCLLKAELPMWQPYTNAECIRNMAVSEMAKFICEIGKFEYGAVAEWLDSKVGEKEFPNEQI